MNVQPFNRNSHFSLFVNINMRDSKIDDSNKHTCNYYYCRCAFSVLSLSVSFCFMVFVVVFCCEFYFDAFCCCFLHSSITHVAI